MTDEEAIRRTLAEYCQLVDDCRLDEWIELFSDDATFTIGGTTATGRTAIRARVERSSADPERRGKHLTLNTVIEVDGDVASSTSDFLILLPRGGRVVPAATGRYVDRFERGAERWRFTDRQVVVPELWQAGG